MFSAYFPITSSFFVEVVLFFLLPCFLLLPLVLNSGNLAFVTAAIQKKIFFLVLRAAQLILLLFLFVDCFHFGQTLTSELHSTILLHTGNFFFRHDLFIWFVNIFLTALTLHYLYLVAFVFSKTTKTVTYIAEIPFLVLCTLLCLRLFIATNDLILMVILLEIAAFCSLIYIGIQSVSSNQYSLSIEATLKYFIINAVAVALLLLAISGYFYLTTSTNLIDIVTHFYKYPFTCVFFTEQLIFVQVVFFFAYLIKLGAAPLHQWVPDVYEGAETLVTCFLVLIISPALMFKFIMFFKLLTAVPGSILFVKTVMLVTGTLSIVFGTLGAFYQTRIKRFIAYAGLTHLGFMLLGLCFNSVLSYFAFLFYLVIYVITNVCFFTFFVFCQQQATQQARVIFMNQLKIPIQTSFFLFFCLVTCLFSFAGIPPFAGFFAKFFILSVLVQQQYFLILVLLIIAILIGTFMYLRFLKICLFETTALLNKQPWAVTLNSSFFSLPKTLVAVFADFTISLKSQNVVYKVTTLNAWHAWLLSVLIWLLGFLFLFLFLFSIYSLGIFELVLVLLTVY
jgi:NADH-quinone oxidoreductase subunit N